MMFKMISTILLLLLLHPFNVLFHWQPG